MVVQNWIWILILSVRFCSFFLIIVLEIASYIDLQTLAYVHHFICLGGVIFNNAKFSLKPLISISRYFSLNKCLASFYLKEISKILVPYLTLSVSFLDFVVFSSLLWQRHSVRTPVMNSLGVDLQLECLTKISKKVCESGDLMGLISL